MEPEVLDVLLDDYKTAASKKAAITRWLKSEEEHLTDLQEAFYRRGKNRMFGMLHGKFVSRWDINRQKQEIQQLKDKYEEL